jgi:hypothetical protein
MVLAEFDPSNFFLGEFDPGNLSVENCLADIFLFPDRFQFSG